MDNDKKFKNHLKVLDKIEETLDKLLLCSKCKKAKSINKKKVKGEVHYKDNELCENCRQDRKSTIKNSGGLGGLFQ